MAGVKIMTSTTIQKLTVQDIKNSRQKYFLQNKAKKQLSYILHKWPT